jgi:hypothetical protein
MHDLRRTLGSWQALGGTSLQIIGKSLGHKSMKATEVYARLTTDPVREAVEKATQTMAAHFQTRFTRCEESGGDGNFIAAEKEHVDRAPTSDFERRFLFVGQ